MPCVSKLSLLVSFFCQWLVLSTHSHNDHHPKTYIVYMGSHPKDMIFTSSHHMSMLQQVIGSTIASDSLLHSYTRSFNGFVAKLTQEEAQKIADGVVSVFPNGKKQLQTTRSWDFTGFSPTVDPILSMQSDIIVGMFDTGIWPESLSFNDEEYSPPPAKWKGACQNSTEFSCNNKIIGGRSYRRVGPFPANDFQSPRDSNGHGTHTASTVAGGLVPRASLDGLGEGTASGGVPSARIAVYKICWPDGCYDADILAAFDDAIADGVDIISVSLAGDIRNYFQDAIAIGAFHAMRRGILTSCAAGNNGPSAWTINNPSPWSLTVAASTIDRKFLTGVQIGDRQIYQGVSINTFDLDGKQFPLVYGRDIPNSSAGFNGLTSRYCYGDSVDRTKLKGKIVLCDAFLTREALGLLEGAAGVLMRDLGAKDVAYSFPLPASYLNSTDGAKIISYYMKYNSNPTATIFKSHPERDELAPFVASFSSRGPNLITPNVLKPDLSGPGVEILAAWSPNASVSGAPNDHRKVHYNILSGTSMACPHATAVAAYVKSVHPSWSPAALKSALMTTASPMDSKLNPDAEFAYGAGHLNPLKAVDPGLIYNASEIDYVKFLCGQLYTSKMVQQLSGDIMINCSEANSDSVSNLNYPSFSLYTSFPQSISQNFKRTVTNVGSISSLYKARVLAPSGLRITVNPSVLSFKAEGEEQSFEVIIEGRLKKKIASASLVWDDGKHKVRSPITVFSYEYSF